MTVARRAVTTVVRFAGAATALAPATSTKELVPQREEIFQASELSTPEGVRDAFHKVQRHSAEATQAARSLPVQGGTYAPDVAFTANTAHTFMHGIVGGLAISWMVTSVRPSGANALAVTQGRIIETAQDPVNGRITLASSEDALADVWFYPTPSASPQ